MSITGTIGSKSANNTIVPVTNLTKRTKQINLTVTHTNPVWNWVTDVASGIAYADSNGKWRLTFNITGSNAGTGNFTVYISGVIFKNGSITYQSGGATSSGTGPALWYVTPNSNILNFVPNSGSHTEWSANGDVELESEPSWAAANMENVAGVDVYIPFGQTGSPGEVLTARGTATSNNSTPQTACSITLTPGIWGVSVEASCSGNSGGYLWLCMSDQNNNSHSSREVLTNEVFQGISGSIASAYLGPIRYSVTTNTTIYCTISVASGSDSPIGRITAVRIAGA